VWLLLYNDHNVAWLRSWVLVGLAMESVLAIVWCTFVDHCVNHLFLLTDFLSFARLTLVCLVNNFTFASAVIAWSLRLRVHARAKLGHSGDNTSTTTCCALLDGSFLSTKSIADSANSLSVYGDFSVLSIVNFFQRAFKWMHDRLAFFGLCRATTSSTATAKHLA